jgi:molecular chaperone GrpE|tara:strand:- start:401 stop:1006 length:606 start_codon:yes stop_codon:yes gene_type:complete
MNKENTDQGSNIEEPLENSGTFINEEESELTAADDPVASDELETDEEEVSAIENDTLLQVATLKEELLRQHAEMDNFRKRMSREQADRLKYHHMELIRELLPAIDSLERALTHSQQQEDASNSIIEGIEMVHRMMQESLNKFGVSRIEPHGEPFDPNCHQAVGMVQTDEVPENHVLDVFQVGYYLHDRVVRPAMVRVAEKS